jgi:SAM-dependent methyltransferase
VTIFRSLKKRASFILEWINNASGVGHAIEVAALQPLAIVAMEDRRKNPLASRGYNPKNYAPAKAENFDDQLQRLQSLEPRAFPLWLECFQRGSAEYDRARNLNCSTWGHRYAEAFRNFCTLFLYGRVLDVGCGPYGKPVYLEDYPSQFISAVEPLPMKEKVDFEVVRGFAESLPWADQSFNVIIIATSLDHVISLDKALDEIKRVMVNNGSVLLWVGVVSGAPVYDPKNPEQFDEHHLFHFDEAWLNPLLLRYFYIEEKLSFLNNLFYRLTKKS